MKKMEHDLIKLLNQFEKEELTITIKNCGLRIEDIKENLKYNVSYKDNKFLVDITKNDIFSYFDTEKELIFKMKKYIKTEQYEKAYVLKKYFDTIELDY